MVTRQKNGRRLLSDISSAAHTPTPLLLAAEALSPPTQSCRIHSKIVGGRLKHHAGHNEILKKDLLFLDVRLAMLLTTVTLTDKSVLGSMALLDGTQLASAAKGVALQF